jgi:hypothetical protein
MTRAVAVATLYKPLASALRFEAHSTHFQKVPTNPESQTPFLPALRLVYSAANWVPKFWEHTRMLSRFVWDRLVAI